MHTLIQDIRFALRQFRKRPAFIATAVLVLALGLGANTAIFSVVSSTLLRPLPFPAPDRLAALYESNIGGGDIYNVVAPGTLEEWRRQAGSFEAVAGYMAGPITLADEGGVPPQRVDAAGVSWQFFPILGVQPIAGRTFTAEEDRHGAARVALLSYGLWQGSFGGAPDIVGRHIRCDGKDCQIVGVMPPRFRFPDRNVQIWIPLALEDRLYRRHDTHFLSVVARLKPGVSVEQARQEVDSISVRYRQNNPGDGIARGANALRLQDGLVREERRPLLLLLAAVGCVLLIACVNVANLLLARASGRAREIAIRAASGAGRARLVRLFLTESVLLSLCGVGVGLLFALAVAEPLAGYAPLAGGGFEGAQLDARVFLFSLVAALATGVAAGLFPAMQFSRGDLAHALREGNRSSTHGSAHRRFRSGLAAIEVALSLVLVIAAGLLLRSFAQLLQVNPGVRQDHTITLMIPWLEMPRDRAVNFFRELPERLGAIPSVISAGLSNCLPVGGHCNDNLFYIEGRPNPPGQIMDALQRNVDPGYFAAIGLPLLRGRTFTQEDGIGDDRKHPGRPVVMVSESLVRAWFGKEDPIGKRLFTNSALVLEHSQGPPAPHYEIVGVVGDVPDALDRPAAPTFYMPLADKTDDDQIYAVLHTAGEPHTAITAARAEIARLNPNLAVDRIRTVRDLVGESAAGHQFQMVLFGSFAVLALVLAAFGLYGVLSYAVSQRRGEIGVRMALGAGRVEVAGLVLREGLEPVLAGVAIGLTAAFFACRLLRSLLFGVGPNDPLTFAVAPLVLVAAAAAACYLPALRAARIDPAITLRGD